MVKYKYISIASLTLSVSNLGRREKINVMTRTKKLRKIMENYDI